MAFKLSNRSLRNLEGVDERLVKVIHRAIEITPTDFVVIQGLRSITEQKKLVAEGKSQTMASYHLTGRAVDVLSLPTRDGSWDVKDYFGIADAVLKACEEQDVVITWGGCWIKPLTDFTYAEDAYNHYLEVRHQQGRTPFIDAPHLQIEG